MRSVSIQRPPSFVMVNLHGSAVITQNPQFTLIFTLCVVCSVVLDKCIMTSADHSRIYRVFSLPQKSPVLLLLIPPSPLVFGNQ